MLVPRKYNLLIHISSNKTCLPLCGTATEDQLPLEQHVVTIGRLSAMTIMLRHNVPWIVACRNCISFLSVIVIEEGDWRFYIHFVIDGSFLCSQTGKKLMAKCRMLIQENQELGRQLSQGRIAQLEAELALQKKYSEELKSSQDGKGFFNKNRSCLALLKV